MILQESQNFCVVTLAATNDVVKLLGGEIFVMILVGLRSRGEGGAIGLTQGVLVLLALVSTRLTDWIRRGKVGVTHGRHDGEIHNIF